jgi:formimidoylglutamate deiminase
LKVVAMTIFAQRALLDGNWAHHVRVVLAGARIATIETSAVAAPDDVRVDALLPALANVHSHSFQRAMAGMTEHKVEGYESFWTWRDIMYRFLQHLTPEHIEAIAAQAFVEMQEAGFAAVGEFHYVHHQNAGLRYANPAELSHRIFAAALETGIGLTHLPVLYSFGGADEQPLSGGQLRFGNTPDEFADLYETLQASLHLLPPDTVLGLAPHSLRATTPSHLKNIAQLAGNAPIHLHIAEQPKEVADIAAWLGARPVEWLLSNLDVGKSWCAIHATHMTADETKRLAQSGAVAGLCPVTEANLGDGPFHGSRWIAEHGAFGVGTDSNISISMTQELRTLEYSQRLRDLQRNILVARQGSVGQFIYQHAAAGGAQALGRNSGTIEVGKLADLLAIDGDHASLCGLQDHQLLDGLCFAAVDNVMTDLWSAGRHQVRGGRHIMREKILHRFRTVMRDLRSLL